MSSIFLSVVVPIYNVEMYLDECVSSILSQTYTNFELILVDDGSKDMSAKICDSYATMDHRVHVIHKLNGGLSDARNVGTALAKGDYIIYIDSDDFFCDKELFGKIVRQAYNGPDLICYKFKKYYEDDNKYVECSFSCPEVNGMSSLSEQISEMVKRDAFYCSAWSKAIRLALIKENNIAFEKGLLGEDQEWYYHILTNVRSLSYLDETVLVYRQRANSITSSWKIKNLSDCIYVIQKWYDRITNEPIDESYKIALLNSIAKLYCNLLIAYTNFDDQNKKQYIYSIKKMKTLLQYHVNPRVNAFYKVYRILGFSGLMFALRIICRFM